MQPAHLSEGEPQELLRSLVEHAPDAIIYADRAGAIRIWNRAAETLFGYTAEDVLGKSLDIIIPERFRNAHWSGFNLAMEAGRTKYAGRALTTRSIHKNGSKLYVSLSFGVVKNGAGSVVGALAIGRPAEDRLSGSPNTSSTPAP